MPIPEIVEKHGWPWFRDLESEIVERFARCDEAILDTGGGVVLRPENIENLRRGGAVFWLKASVDVIVERIQESTERPSPSSMGFEHQRATTSSGQTTRSRTGQRSRSRRAAT